MNPTNFREEEAGHPLFRSHKVIYLSEQFRAGLCLDVLGIEQPHSRIYWGHNGSRLTVSLITISRQEQRQERRTGIPPPLSDISRLFRCSCWAQAELQVAHPETNQLPLTTSGLNIETGLLIFVPAPALSVLISLLFLGHLMRELSEHPSVLNLCQGVVCVRGV